MRSHPASSLVLVCVLLLLPCGATAAANCEDNEIPAGPLRYEIVAGGARLNRQLTGPVVNYVNGVPAEPVDSFVYDGDGSVPIDGHFKLVVDPVAEVGIIEASWTDDNGEWKYTQTAFVHPDHWSGVRLGSSIAWVDFFINEAITSNVYLHGDTDAGMPVLPTVFTYAAAWGPALVERNGQPFDNPFEIPAPLWVGHVMVTEGVRHPDGTVRSTSGDIYNPGQHASTGGVEEGDLEAHLTFHDERFPATTNFPPIFSFFYHLVFEDVSITVTENDDPILIDPTCTVLGHYPGPTPRALRTGSSQR